MGTLTTGIGSLPHHNVDAALEFSFKHDIPYLPQIPIRNAWEYMIPQALEGLPGLLVEKDGTVLLDINVWSARAKAFSEKLSLAFENSISHRAFESFEPSAASFSSWQPFLWELQERKVKLAKIQLAGPLTSQWALKLLDSSSIFEHPDLTTQIYKLVLARTLAMCCRLKEVGVQPFCYIDEPALYAFSIKEPRHLLAVQELKILIQAMKKEGVLVGLHCCSNTNWKVVLELGLDFISLDVQLSLESVLACDEVKLFLKAGGHFSFGVIPTSKTQAQDQLQLNPQEIFLVLKETLLKYKLDPKQVLAQALYTPACGLALHSTSYAETVFEHLTNFRKELQRFLS